MPGQRILDVTGRDAYDKPPVLNATERCRAFDPPSSLLELAGTLARCASRARGRFGPGAAVPTQR